MKLRRKGQTIRRLEDTHPDKSVLGLVFLSGVEVVVDETESSGLATSKLRAESEHKDGLGIAHLVDLSKLLL